MLRCNSAYRLRYWNEETLMLNEAITGLQQCLPLAVLKLKHVSTTLINFGISCNSAYRLRYWNIFWLIHSISSHARVATVLTACGIETLNFFKISSTIFTVLQQCLPLAVLKLVNNSNGFVGLNISCNSAYRLRYWNAIKAYFLKSFDFNVATVLTACGIETNSY